MATKADTADTLVALESFIGHDGKEERVIREGELIRPNDRAAQKWPAKFGPARFIHDAPKVEQATAAPGEVRS